MNEMRENTGRGVGAVILIGLGLMFLVGQVFNFTGMGSLWPFFIILPGAAVLLIGLFGERRTAPMIIPGTIITATGAILLYQNMTDHWESWAYIWAVYPALTGLAMMAMGRRIEQEAVVRNGRRLVKIGLVLLVAFGIFFEFFIFNSVLDMGILNYIGAVVLIGAGLMLLFRDNIPFLRSEKSKGKNEENYL
jgi:hypothetical protein